MTTPVHLVRRDPDTWYFDSHLWVPKKFIKREHIAAALTYEKGQDEYIYAWEEAPNHFKVPRNLYPVDGLIANGNRVIDSRWKKYPYYKFHSRVVLDSREPDKNYQSAGSAALSRVLDGILTLRCGGGKTLVSLHTVAQTNQPFMVVVNDKGLAKQWQENIEFALGLKPDEIGRVGGDGGPFDWKKPAVIALVQTLASRASDRRIPAEMIQHFGTIICDEAHILGAPYFNLAIPPFHGRRWGLSATPTRDDGFDSLLNYTLGKVVYTYLTPNLVPKVYFKQLDTNIGTNPKAIAAITDRTGQFHRMLAYGYFARECPERVKAIASDIQEALDKGRQVLVLTHSRDMVEALGAHFPQAGLVHGDVKEEDRNYRIKNCNPLIAIIQLGKQALDKPSLDTLFLCEPTTKQGVLQQVMGRVLRIYGGKKEPVVVIYEDRYIKPLQGMCNKIRYLFRKWPKAAGGRIDYQIVKG